MYSMKLSRSHIISCNKGINSFKRDARQPVSKAENNINLKVCRETAKFDCHGKVFG